MEWIVYFGLALISLEVDAVVCHTTKRKFRWMAAVCMALFWPITSTLAIIAVINQQNDGSEGCGG